MKSRTPGSNRPRPQRLPGRHQRRRSARGQNTCGVHRIGRDSQHPDQSSTKPDDLCVHTTQGRLYRLSLLRGVVPVMMDYVADSDTLIRAADQVLIQHQLATRLETVIIVTGVMNVSGATNMMKIHRVDES